ncbi:hypothetical protein CRE_00464 [Caenorhabditis remanei]|uniref:Uncharacterized protein n=1 Tax=Caenorhabditis remanei TaxID=31234 RepID=E3LCZ1_CAERE|nr:hypothetical protein CRE_00464 [Caenorhabditis remanei]
MNPPIGGLFLVTIVFFVSFSESFSNYKPTVGKLTIAENEERMDVCGVHNLRDLENGETVVKEKVNYPSSKYLTALSTRHIILSPLSNLLGFIYNKDQCKNNIQVFKINSTPNVPGKLNEELKAHYIGSCEHDVPRGFVILEQSLPNLRNLVFNCLPGTKIKAGNKVEVITKPNPTVPVEQYITTNVNFCKNMSEEMCTEQLFDGSGGPVFDITYQRRIYVGHTTFNDNESTRVEQIYPYLQEICDVAGICDKATSKFSHGSTSFLSSFDESKLSFVDPDEPVIHVNFPPHAESSEDTIVTSLNTALNSVIDVEDVDVGDMKVEIEEIESSGTTSEETKDTNIEQRKKFQRPLKPGSDIHETELQSNFSSNREKVLILFDSDGNESEPVNYEPLVMSVVPEQKIDEPAPQDSTIVRAEPRSAVIIPLSKTDSKVSITSVTPSKRAFLIVALIAISLIFLIQCCLYGFFGYKGAVYYWRPLRRNASA